ncbi:hypothetical protein Dsin_024757 [Dipteronia sinensis]|uniref:Reverse transcriptase zinc-binding domain-containing protein n=1 Tax=Dipteronia sinensis TaxID=43782 RepID=A0AAD9ZUJ8_9ROSI|nr:hypothetical protein Dsin_024757 [Dipteronia sinensis]
MEDNARLTLPIPCSVLRWDESLYWHYTTNREYTVKSGYKVGLSLIAGQVSSSSRGSDPLWNALWRLHVLLKVRIFLWRACHHWIPTMVNLVRSKIPVTDVCPNCNWFLKTTVDARGYPVLKEVHKEGDFIKGYAMATCAQRIHSAEVVVELHGIELAIDIGLLLAIVERYALSVVNLVKDGNPIAADVGLVIRDIIDRL